MPDGARFERGGEFIETGYDHMLRRRAAEHALALAEHGFEFAAREVRSGGRAYPTLLLEAERALAATVEALGADASAVSAADALLRTPLAPLARTALTRRLEGTYTVELDCVSASWLASADVRAADSATHLGSSRLAAGNDALAKALAAELGDRVRLDCPVSDLRNVEGGVTLRGPAPRALRTRRARRPAAARARAPARCARERRSYERLCGDRREKLHVPLTEPAAPAAVQGLEAAFWTWTASGAGGGPATVAASFAGGFARPRPSRSSAASLAGGPRWSAFGPSSRARRRGGAHALVGRRVLRRRLRLPSARLVARDDEEVAAPYGRIHLAGEHTAAEFCGTMEGALRSGARAAPEVLAARETAERICIDQCPICDLHWWLADGSREARSTVQPLAGAPPDEPSGTGSQLLGAVVVPFRRDITRGGGGEPDRHAASSPARRQEAERCAASGEASQKSSSLVASPRSLLRETAHISTGSSPSLRCERGVPGDARTALPPPASSSISAW